MARFHRRDPGSSGARAAARSGRGTAPFWGVRRDQNRGQDQRRRATVPHPRDRSLPRISVRRLCLGGSMKYLRSAVFALGLLLVVSATQAQQVRVKAEIPFDFVVGNQVLPAGEYTVMT